MDAQVEAEVQSIRRPLTLAAIVIAVLICLGAVMFVGARLADRLLGGPTPQTVASASLESMRSQNRLNVFAARYVSVTSSRATRFGFTAERTLILPGDVRYEVDLSKLRPEDVQWDGSNHTLSVMLPEIEIAGPDVDLTQAREYGAGGVLSSLTNANQGLDRANREAAVADLRTQALAAVPMRLAREAARQAVERSFAMPLMAAGFSDVKVAARFPTDGRKEDSQITASVPYQQAIDDYHRRKAAEGKK